MVPSDHGWVKGIDEIAVGVLCQAFQRHGTAGSITDQAFQLVSPMRGDGGGGMQRKPVDAGTAGTAQERALALGAKARAHAPDLLSSPLAKGEALLHQAAMVRASSGAGSLPEPRQLSGCCVLLAGRPAAGALVWRGVGSRWRGEESALKFF